MKAHLWILGLFAVVGLFVAGCSTQVAEDDDADGVLLARDDPDTVNIYEDDNPDSVIVDNPNPVIVEDNEPDSIFIDDGEPDTTTNTNNYYYGGDTGESTGTSGEDTTAAGTQ